MKTKFNAASNGLLNSVAAIPLSDMGNRYSSQAALTARWRWWHKRDGQQQEPALQNQPLPAARDILQRQGPQYHAAPSGQQQQQDGADPWASGRDPWHQQRPQDPAAWSGQHQVHQRDPWQSYAPQGPAASSGQHHGIWDYQTYSKDLYERRDLKGPAASSGSWISESGDEKMADEMQHMLKVMEVM